MTKVWHICLFILISIFVVFVDLTIDMAAICQNLNEHSQLKRIQRFGDKKKSYWILIL